MDFAHIDIPVHIYMLISLSTNYIHCRCDKQFARIKD